MLFITRKNHHCRRICEPLIDLLGFLGTKVICLHTVNTMGSHHHQVAGLVPDDKLLALIFTRIFSQLNETSFIQYCHLVDDGSPFF